MVKLLLMNLGDANQEKKVRSESHGDVSFLSALFKSKSYFFMTTFQESLNFPTLSAK